MTRGRSIRALLRNDGPVRWIPVYTDAHNYFPDGAVVSDDLIDVDGDQDYDTKVWYGIAGNETLSRHDHGGNTAYDGVLVSCPGDDWGEGVAAQDWMGNFGFDDLPAGFYEIGFVFRLNFGDPAHARAFLVAQGNTRFSLLEDLVLKNDFSPHRYVLRGYLETSGSLQLGFEFAQDSAGTEAAPVTDFIVGQIMFTERSAATFRDGDSEGWEWSGTPNASVSSGPQP